MDRNLEYVRVLAECRGCLAALADQSPLDLSLIYELMLLVLDAMHGDESPALEVVSGDSREVMEQLLRSLDRLAHLGVRRFG